MPATKTLSELAELCGAVLEGDGARRVGPAALEEAGPDEISFVAHPRYVPLLERTRAAAVLVEPGLDCAREGLSLLRCEDPSGAFTRVVGAFARAEPRPAPGVDESARVHPDAVLGADVAVGPFCLVGAGARLGAGCVLHAHVTVGAEVELGPGCELYPGAVVIARSRLGARCVLHPGAVVGSDGFGFDPTPEGWVKVPQTGTVEVGDDVEIGANATIDRGRFRATVIGAGAKLDNLVQVAHNCEIGPGALLCAQAGVAGSTKVGPGAILGGQVGVGGHLEVGARARVAGQSGVYGDLPGGEEYLGSPARPRAEALRAMAQAGRVPRLMERLRELERRLAELEGGAS